MRSTIVLITLAIIAISVGVLTVSADYSTQIYITDYITADCNLGNAQIMISGVYYADDFALDYQGIRCGQVIYRWRANSGYRIPYDVLGTSTLSITGLVEVTPTPLTPYPTSTSALYTPTPIPPTPTATLRPPINYGDLLVYDELIKVQDYSDPVTHWMYLRTSINGGRVVGAIAQIWRVAGVQENVAVRGNRDAMPQYGWGGSTYKWGYWINEDLKYLFEQYVSPPYPQSWTFYFHQYGYEEQCITYRCGIYDGAGSNEDYRAHIWYLVEKGEEGEEEICPSDWIRLPEGAVMYWDASDVHEGENDPLAWSYLAWSCEDMPPPDEEPLCEVEIRTIEDDVRYQACNARYTGMIEDKNYCIDYGCVGQPNLICPYGALYHDDAVEIRASYGDIWVWKNSKCGDDEVPGEVVPGDGSGVVVTNLGTQCIDIGIPDTVASQGWGVRLCFEVTKLESLNVLGIELIGFVNLMTTIFAASLLSFLRGRK